MIFVILGIIILTISFVAALVSLIREQKKGAIKEVDVSLEPQLQNTTQTNPDIAKTAPRIQSQNTPDENTGKPEKFPWEGLPNEKQNAKTNSGEIQDPPAEEKLGGGFSVSELAKKKNENF